MHQKFFIKLNAILIFKLVQDCAISIMLVVLTIIELLTFPSKSASELIKNQSLIQRLKYIRLYI